MESEISLRRMSDYVHKMHTRLYKHVVCIIYIYEYGIHQIELLGRAILIIPVYFKNQILRGYMITSR